MTAMCRARYIQCMSSAVIATRYNTSTVPTGRPRHLLAYVDTPTGGIFPLGTIRPWDGAPAGKYGITWTIDGGPLDGQVYPNATRAVDALIDLHNNNR